MLMDINDKSPDSEEQAAMRARIIAYNVAMATQGQHLADIINGVSVLILESMQHVPSDSQEAMDARRGIAGHLRHVADHIDLTCPGCFPPGVEKPAAEEDEAAAPNAPSTPTLQ
jgi:hypothetical protein